MAPYGTRDTATTVSVFTGVEQVVSSTMRRDPTTKFWSIDPIEYNGEPTTWLKVSANSRFGIVGALLVARS